MIFFSYQWLGLILRSRGYLLFLSLPICPRPPYTPFVVKIAFAVVLVAKNKNRINRETKGGVRMWPRPHGHGWTLLAWDKRSDCSGPGPRLVSNDNQTGNIRRLRTAVNEAAASWAHPGLRVVRVLASKFQSPNPTELSGHARDNLFFLLYFARCTVGP